MGKWMSLMLVVMVSGCGPSEPQMREAARAKQNAEISLKVKESFKDPDSAKVVIQQVFPLFDGQVACGTVNAKNSFGGYVGDHSFDVGINPDGSIGIPSIARDERESLLKNAMCEFQKEYGSRPGNSGKQATVQQASAFKTEYTKKVHDVVAALTPP